MKCSNCRKEMDKGRYHSSGWIKEEPSKVRKSLLHGTLGKKWEMVISWRCPECGKIELYSDLNR